ncbi:hypothetical protein AMAG_08433 [Allomyces macrogynus ATCC 38327]|uniref:Uncharacterized protein n=1 Tax=Allomyces macrogynus (strain ATCC 38327) TaxID=578462 RepID=A0A0L0SLA1_ALLM3|nr:hypothetical protein AMAG_08433 [Allomyces macrogynus ATCC 38327]|eukprot:KNE63292.1 hypothetical protein AMAG_08433 [Allomyces macrogynus ATCC 38327]
MSVITNKMRKTWPNAKWFRARGPTAAESKVDLAADSSALTLAGCSITLTAFGHWPAPSPASTATISRAAAKISKRSSTSASATTASMQPVLDAPILHVEPASATTNADRVLPLVARAIRRFLTLIVDSQLLEVWAGFVDGSSTCPGRADGDGR